jgi:hypothetical protein
MGWFVKIFYSFPHSSDEEDGVADTTLVGMPVVPPPQSPNQVSPTLLVLELQKLKDIEAYRTAPTSPTATGSPAAMDDLPTRTTSPSGTGPAMPQATTSPSATAPTFVFGAPTTLSAPIPPTRDWENFQPSPEKVTGKSPGSPSSQGAATGDQATPDSPQSVIPSSVPGSPGISGITALPTLSADTS